MMGTACRSPLGGHQKGSFFGRRGTSTSSIDFRHPARMAATNQAFAEPLVATTAVFVRADRGGIHHD
jgi:hypothetical protein